MSELLSPIAEQLENFQSAEEAMLALEQSKDFDKEEFSGPKIEHTLINNEWVSNGENITERKEKNKEADLEEHKEIIKTLQKKGFYIKINLSSEVANGTESKGSEYEEKIHATIYVLKGQNIEMHFFHGTVSELHKKFDFIDYDDVYENESDDKSKNKKTNAETSNIFFNNNSPKEVKKSFSSFIDSIGNFLKQPEQNSEETQQETFLNFFNTPILSPTTEQAYEEIKDGQNLPVVDFLNLFGPQFTETANTKTSSVAEVPQNQKAAEVVSLSSDQETTSKDLQKTLEKVPSFNTTTEPIQIFAVQGPETSSDKNQAVISKINKVRTTKLTSPKPRTTTNNQKQIIELSTVYQELETKNYSPELDTIEQEIISISKEDNFENLVKETAPEQNQLQAQEEKQTIAVQPTTLKTEKTYQEPEEDSSEAISLADTSEPSQESQGVTSQDFQIVTKKQSEQQKSEVQVTKELTAKEVSDISKGTNKPVEKNLIVTEVQTTDSETNKKEAIKDNTQIDSTKNFTESQSQSITAQSEDLTAKTVDRKADKTTDTSLKKVVPGIVNILRENQFIRFEQSETNQAAEQTQETEESKKTTEQALSIEARLQEKALDAQIAPLYIEKEVEIAVKVPEESSRPQKIVSVIRSMSKAKGEPALRTNRSRTLAKTVQKPKTRQVGQYAAFTKFSEQTTKVKENSQPQVSKPASRRINQLVGISRIIKESDFTKKPEIKETVTKLLSKVPNKPQRKKLLNNSPRFIGSKITEDPEQLQTTTTPQAITLAA